ncbi:MAG: acyl transferase, partial [Bacteroidota bacterium]
SYLERNGSSLVYMTERLIKQSQHTDSGFYLFNYDDLMKKLMGLKAQGQKTLVIGVTFALLELANLYQEDLSGIIFMETGGMKGRGKEITRRELHEILKSRFNLSSVHSEYGMTELLSQAYSSGEGIFYPPPWMKILIRDSHDPFDILPPGKSGAINVLDLANRYSCSFLATSDIGKIHIDGSFEILGRMDFSEVRGCNLLVEG